MKSLLLVRHAKSSWDFEVEDFDRPLNKRGQNDAPVMVKRLIKKQIEIDAFVSSPAKRAISTACYFAEGYHKKITDILAVLSLYEPTLVAFDNVINELNDDLKTVAVFSHNPVITDFANRLTSFKINDMPTCAVFAVQADVKSWREFLSAPKEFLFFDYPKSN